MKKATLCAALLFLLISVRSGAQTTKRWYSYTQYFTEFDAEYVDSAVMPIWKDTTSIIGNSAATPVYNFNYFTSVGMSFAPVLATWNDPTLFGTSIQVSQSDAYTIDSIRIHGRYMRNNAKTAPVDTIFFSFVNGNGSDTSNLPDFYYNSLDAYYGYDTVNFLMMCYDSVNSRAGRFAGNPTAPYVQYITLSNTDTATNFNRTITLATPYPVQAGRTAAVSLSFKSGDASFTPFDTVQYESGAFKYGDFLPRIIYNSDGSNPIYPVYNPIDTNVGYFANESAATNEGYRGYYVPTWGWIGGTTTIGNYLQYPEIDFHITCPTCSSNFAISGTPTVCAGATTTLSSGGTGGTWSSSSTTIATVGSSSGVVNGVAAGTASISYTLSGSTISVVVTVNAATNAGTVTGTANVCVTATTTLTDATPGGTWSSSNTLVATVASTGVVTGAAGGTATISYTVGGICGNASATVIVTVNAASAGTITGPDVVCMASTIPLSDLAGGGVWSSSNTNAVIGSLTGVVIGNAAGTSTITYSVSGICGLAHATYVVTVNTIPSTSPINGPTAICTTSITLSDDISGGVWTSSNTSIAIISAAFGIVSGVTPGTATITYTLSNSCGNSIVTTVVTVDASPSVGVITGPNTVCDGYTITLSDGTSGGVWSSSNTANASVGSLTGIVSGLATGATTISYTVTNACGSIYATYPVTVSLSGTIAGIAGTLYVCAGSTTGLSEATGGGTWSSSNTGIATIGSTGQVTGVAGGTTTISYTVTGSCAAYATASFTVNPLPSVDSISGASGVCTTSSVTLSDLVAGGVWSSTNTSIATAGSSSGTIAGVAPGTVSIRYTVTNSCGSVFATHLMTVSSSSFLAAITGSLNVCVSATTSLSDATFGGEWSSGNTGIATIGSSTGIVSGVAAGTATITYIISGSCGTPYVTAIVTVNPLPSAGTITGLSSVCPGLTIPLSDAASGGVWTSSNSSLASVGSLTGVVTGNDPGVVTISYTVTNSCGSISATYPVTVNPLPGFIGAITGTLNVCTGSSTDLTDASTGGTWTSGNTAVATVGSTGIVNGIAPGTSPITYTIGVCSPVEVIAVVTVNSMPTVDSISGPSSVCLTSAITLSDLVSGGVWSSTNTSIAAAGSSSGAITGEAAGTVSIRYTVTNSCGTVFATHLVTVNSLPGIAPITGTLSICVSELSVLSDATSGGTWTSSNTGIATIASIDGIAEGVAAGTATITYTASSSCGAPYITATVTVNTTPSAGTITGPTEVCSGSSIDLSDATGSGVWSSSNTTVATVGSSSGVVSGATAGTVVISYTVTNSCGSATATATIHVNSPATAGTITGSSTVCIGAYDTLADAASGGIWTAINGHAFVSSDGVVIGASAGVDTIVYTITFTCTTSTTANATITVTVNPAPNAGTITGADTVCIGDTVSLSDAAAGGTWTAANGNAFISTSGVVFGFSAGSDNISYSVTNTCGTNVVTELMYIKDCTAGINNIQAPAQRITLYPNPAQDNIMITSSAPIHDVVISNLVGQQVFSGSYNTSEAVINLSQLPAGVYLAKINGTEVRKFVKE